MEDDDSSQDEEPTDNNSSGWMRQPIVSILGHVDHGKTSILDHIRSLGVERQASVMDREAGGITQHIGATEVPAEVLNNTCAELLGGKEFKSPGLLFIDTPGHQSFTSLRSRGGNLADIAILVVDVIEGLKPQTIESLRILKDSKTPFLIAANKIDRISGWHCERGRAFLAAWQAQRRDTHDLFEERYWKLVGQFSEYGFNVERYDLISDFTQSVAIVPCSAKEGEGLQDLLAIAVGLAERFLEERLKDTLGAAEATVLEMKDERGLGKTIDIILNRGELNIGDKITLVSPSGPFTTHIKAMFRAKGMSEMRDAGDRWESCDHAIAACGLKISAPGLEDVLAGTTLRQTRNADELAIAEQLAYKEARITVELAEEGVLIKADTIGGLEALAFELNKMEIPIRLASIGSVNKKDILNAEAAKDPLHRVILGFAVTPNSEVAPRLENNETGAKFIGNDIIYQVLERFEEWSEETKRALDVAHRENLVYPARLLYMKDHTFRNRSPAIVGMRILGGKVHLGQRIMKLDGTAVGQIKSLRSTDGLELKKASQGDEVAMAISGPTVGRHIEELDEFLVDIPSSHAKRLRSVKLNPVEEEILEEITRIHRQKDHFWGR